MRDPILYPNWVWLLGILLLVLAVAWVSILWVAYRRSNRAKILAVATLSEQYRQLYSGQLTRLYEEYQQQQIDVKQLCLYLAAITRAAASERLGTDIENLTVEQVQERYPEWTDLVGALIWCHDTSFTPKQSEIDLERIKQGFSMVAKVVGL